MKKMHTISQLIAKKKLIGLDPEEEKIFKDLMQDPMYQQIYDELDMNDIDDDIKVLDDISTKNKSIRLKPLLRYAAAVIVLGILVAGGTWFYKNKYTGKQYTESKNETSVLITSNDRYDLTSAKNNSEIDQVTISQTGHLSYQPEAINLKSTYHTIRACDTANVSVTLVDGTDVILNVNSELSYKVPFEKDQRQVKLNGEAYFKVAHNEQQPFVVLTKDQDVKVLGTSFNVRAYNNSKQVVTTLVEGKISAKFNSFALDNYETILAPNQQLILDRSTKKAQVVEVDTYPYTAWTNNRFVFRNSELEHIMAKLSQWYSVKISYENEMLKSQKFSLDVKRYSSFSEILHLLEKTNTVKFNTINKHVLVQEYNK